LADLDDKLKSMIVSMETTQGGTMALAGRSATEFQRMNAQVSTSKSILAVLKSLSEVQSTLKLFDSKLAGSVPT
jgi:hypothetical protein